VYILYMKRCGNAQLTLKCVVTIGELIHVPIACIVRSMDSLIGPKTRKF
jgi:hypothetical protein